MRTGRAFVAAAAVVVMSLLVPAVSASAASPPSELVLQGALTFVDATGFPTTFPSATCEAFTREEPLSVRGVEPRTQARSARLERSRSLVGLTEDLCRLSFQVRPPSGSASFVVSIGGKRLGRWTRDELRAHEGWLFFTVRGGSKVSSWQVTELEQVHENVPVPDNTETVQATSFDPVAWQQDWTTIPGTADDRCATVDDETSVRAGSILAGNFASYRDGWNGTVDASKFWYIPMHPDGRPPLSVVAQHLDASGAPIGEAVSVLGDHNSAWTTSGQYFYATSTLLPERGSWRMTVTAGANQGCFDFVL